MKHAHPDINNKPFTYVHLDKSFLRFASDECTGLEPHELLNTLEQTIRFKHKLATPLPPSGHPRTIWELATEHLLAHYQILPDCVEIGLIVSEATGLPYEPCHDLFAAFTG